MKRTLVILLIAAFTVSAIVDAQRTFGEAVTFYGAHPTRLLQVLGITVVGGLLALAFYRMSTVGRRRAKLLAVGGMAMLLTVFLGNYLLQLLPLSSTQGSPAALLFLALPLGIFGALAAGCWYEFFHVLRTGRTRFLR
jgi:hypothetical protein